MDAKGVNVFPCDLVHEVNYNVEACLLESHISRACFFCAKSMIVNVAC